MNKNLKLYNMKNLLLIGLLFTTAVKAQNGSITCDGSPKQYSYGYVCYKQAPIGTIVKVEYSGAFWWTYMSIQPFGVVQASPLHVERV